MIRNGLQWKDAPRGYGAHKTLYNRFIHWSRRGVFDRIFAALAGGGPKPEGVMIDSICIATTLAFYLNQGVLSLVLN